MANRKRNIQMKFWVTEEEKRLIDEKMAQLPTKRYGAYLRGHESEIILFEAAARELKRLGAVPLPTTESMKTELANLSAERERLLAEYKTARTEAQEYETVKQNVDALLAVPKEQEQQRRHELE